MKKIFFLLLILNFLLLITHSLYAQSDKKVKLNRMEKKLVGTWVLTEMNILNIEDVATAIYDMQQNMLDQQLESLNEELSTTEDEYYKKSIQAQIDEIEKSKEDLSIESIKEDANSMNNDLSITFNEDKTYSSGFENNATWHIDQKKSELHITIDTVIILTIEKLELKKLILYSETPFSDSLIVQNRMTFKADKSQNQPPTLSPSSPPEKGEKLNKLEKKLVGTWELSKYNDIDSTNSDMKIIFTKHREFIIFTQIERGTWWIDKKLSELHLIMDSEIIYKIDKLKQDKLILYIKENNDYMTFIKTKN